VEELGRRSALLEMRILRLDEKEVDVEAIATPVFVGSRPAVQIIINDMTERKNTELRLRLQATVLSQVSDAVVAVGKDGRVIFWNEAAERLYRVPARDAIGRPREDIFRYRWIAPEAEQAAQQSLSSSGFLRGENIHVLKTGEEVFVESAVSVLQDWSGNPAGWLAVMRDVTERKIFEQKLRESEERYRSLVESSPDAIFVSQGGKLVYVNQATLKLIGTTDRSRLIGQDAIAFCHFEYRDRVVARLGEAEEKGIGGPSRELSIVRFDGRPVPVESVLIPIAFNGRPAVQIMMKDITERKQAEDELRRAHVELELRVKERTAELAATIEALQEEIAERRRMAAERDRLVAAVESAAEAIVITDTRGTIQYVNPAFEQVTGYRRADAAGKDLHMLDSGQNDEEFYRRMREKIRAEGVWKGRLINKKKDGSVYYEDCTYSPVRDRQGNIVNFVSIKHDVTEKLRLESIAETVDTMNNIGYVFSGIRHEIGNPVSSLLIIMSLLKKKYDTTPKEIIKEYVDQAIAQVERLEYLLSSLKSFNMYESLQIRNTEVTGFMDKFLTLIRPDLIKKGIHLEVEQLVRDGVIPVDTRALQQALLNVVVNASDALDGRPQPKIVLSVDRVGSMVRIRVADNGVGIPEERKKELFKPFYTTKPHGTGLGLVITRKLVSRMKGFIEIESSGDRGTVVDIHLPEGTIEPIV
jgi:PAS domain S-box-containing protein